MTTHIAGSSIDVQGRVIQRCAVCGEKLVDSKGAAIRNFPVWAVGAMISVDGENRTLLPCKKGEMPTATCLELVEA